MATNSPSPLPNSPIPELPFGVRFLPTDEELVLFYLKRKLQNLSILNNKISEVNIYEYHPQKLAGQYKRNLEGKYWYFFTRKYENGSRRSRPAGHGFWKASAAEGEVKHNGHVVGLRRSLVYFVRIGKAQKLIKTNWFMHEFRMKDPPNDIIRESDDWVLCRIENRNKARAAENQEECSVVENEDEDDDDEADQSSLLYQHDPYLVYFHNHYKQFVETAFSCIVY